jgi:hypothetical protein
METTAGVLMACADLLDDVSKLRASQLRTLCRDRYPDEYTKEQAWRDEERATALAPEERL